MANDWTPPSDGVAVGSSFVPPSDAVKKKDLTASGLGTSSSGRLTTTTTKATVSSSSKGEIFTGYPGKEEKPYQFKDGKWYEEAPLKVYGQKAQYVQIQDPNRIGNLNKQFKKDASLSQQEEVFNNYDDEKSDNQYRIKDGQWQRMTPGSKWHTIQNEGSINALNNRYGKSVSTRVVTTTTMKPAKFDDINSDFMAKTEEDAIKKLTEKYGKLGFEFSEEGLFAIDQIRVKTKDGSKEKVFEFDEKNPEQARELRAFLEVNATKSYSENFDKALNNLNKFEGKDQMSGPKMGTGQYGYQQQSAIIRGKNLLSNDFQSEFKKLPFEEQKEIIQQQIIGTGIPTNDVQSFYKSAAYQDYKKKKVGGDQQSKSKQDQIYDDYQYALATKDPAKIKEAKAKIDAYYTDDIIQDNVKTYNMKLNDFEQSQKNILQDRKAYDEEVSRFNELAQSGKMTQEQYDAQKKILDDKAESLETRAQNFVIQKKEIQASQNKLNLVAGKYVAAKEKEGSLSGFLVNKVLSGVSMTFVEPFAALEATGQNFYNQLSPEEKAYYKSIQHNGKNLTREQIENLLANKAMLRAKNEAKESIIKTLGSEGTTLEYMKSGDRGFITQAIGGVLESLPAMATGMAGKAVGFTGLALQAYSGIEEEMLSDPDFQYTSAGDRAIIAIPYAAGMGVLENVGLQNLVKGDSFLGKVMMDVAIKSAKKLGANATKEALERVAAKEVESLLAKGLIRVTQAGVAEFETGFTQALVLDQGLKQAYNWIQQSGMTEEQRKNLTQGEYFDTADSLKELGSKTFEDGVAEMIGGFTMGSVGTVLQAVVNGNISLYNEDDVKFLKDVVADSNFKKLYVASMKTQMLDGKITKSKAQQNLDNLNEIEAAFDMMPDGLSTADMNKSLSLITERAQLTREKAGKDPNLVAPLEARIKTINEELTKIGENAVQEQATSKVPLQPGAESGGEVAQGKPEAGSQEVTQEGSQAQEIVQSEENQALIDSFIESERESINNFSDNFFTQEEKQALIDRLEADPIAYAESLKGITAINTFLNSLQRQPVAQEEIVDLPPTQNVGVLITPATVRNFSEETGKLKELSLEYDTLVKEYSDTKNPETWAKVKQIESEILDNAQKEIEADVAKMPGVEVEFGKPRMGLWDGKFEPSFNMNLKVSEGSNTTATSEMLINFAEKYSQDAFILETDSDLDAEVSNSNIDIPYTEFDGDGMMHYPQINYTFANNLSDQQIADLSNKLQDSGITAFSLNDQELKISVITFLEDNLSEDEQFTRKEQEFRNKLDNSADAIENILGDNGVYEQAVAIKRSSYQGAKNEGSSDQTRQYDRGDVLKSISKKEQSVADLAKKLLRVAQKSNLVTNDNINDIIDSQDIETRQKIAKSAKLVMRAIPEAKIYLHNNTAEYNGAVGEETDGTEKGSFIASDGAIHINMQEAFPHTLLHEAFHYVILNKGIDGKILNGWAKSLRSIVKDKKVLDRIDRLIKNYSTEEQAEEFISELGGIMGVAKGQLTTSALQKFKTLINKIAKAIGLPPIFTAASTTQDAVDFINTISKQLVTGDQIITEGYQSKIVSTDMSRKKQVKVAENQKLTFVKQSDIIDFKSLVDDIVSKDQTVWFWVADQLGRGMYFDSELNGQHYLDAGPSYALDPENRKNGIIWASGKSNNELQKLVNNSDYIFIISGSPEQSKLFNKTVSSLIKNRIESKVKFDEFKSSLLNAKPTKAIREILEKYNSYDEIFLGIDRKKFIIAINEQKAKETPAKKLLESYGAFVDPNELRDGFFKDNNFDMGDVMLVLKPTGVGGKANHSTYENNVLGEVIGVPDIIVNSYNILPEDVRNKYRDDLTKTQQQQVVAPYGIGTKKVQQVPERKKQLTTDKDAKPGYETALDALGENETQREEWRKKNKVNQKQKRNPVVEQAVKDYYNEEISQEEYLDIVSKNQPIKPFKEVPALPSLEEITNSLDSSKVATGIVGLTKNIEEGEKVATRLDIPAYEDFDTWVVSIHDGVKEGKSVAYGQTAVLKNVDFKTFPGPAIRIAMGTQNKSTIARMFGNWVNEDPESVHARAKELMNDPAWTQVGMNPFRYSWFYDKADGMPLASAEEVVQVGALVLAKNAVKVSPTDPMFETKSAKGGKIKFQKGFSKQEAIRKAKEKYVLSVKERGNTPEQGVTSALEDLRKSEWYNEADDLMREEAERELKKFFGEKMKAAPSIKKVMAIKPTKIQVEEMAALKSQIRLEAKAAREAKGDLNAKRKALAAAITGMVRQGKITAVQARSIINKVSRVNLDNPVMVDRLISYAERVFDRADYQETLSKAAKIRKSIKKAMKSKDLQAEVAGMAKKFSGVDPFMVEDIDQYIENAEKVLNAVRPVRETEVPLRQAADIEAISEYTTAQVERQEANKKAELLALNKYLVEAGIVTDDMTAKEIQEMVDIIAAEEYEVENADKKLNFLKNRFDFMSGVIEEMIVNNKDIFTDEALDLTQSQKELMREVLKFDIDKLSVKQAAQVLEAMDNFINNGITSGLEAVVNNYQGNLNADRLASSGKRSRPLSMYFNKRIGRIFGEQVVSLPLLIERMFPGMANTTAVVKGMGLNDLMRGSAKADYDHKQLLKQYSEQAFYKNKKFMDAKNVYERGMLAFLNRNLAGTETERRNEFLRRINILEESIKVLEYGTKEESKMSEVYQEVYNKLKVSDRDLDVIKANAEQMNIDAVDWMTQKWAEKYSDLSDISLSVYNSILGSDTNYTPDRLKLMDGSEIELDKDLLNRGSAFMSSVEYVDKNKSGVLIESARPKTLPKDRFVSLDFDANNFRSLKGAMIDIETAAAIRKIDGFISSDGFKKLIKSGDDRKLLKDRLTLYIKKVKGKESFDRDTLNDVSRLANFFATLGVGKALGGLDQPIKQTIPVIFNTLANAGRFTPVDAEMNEAINRSGMPIANRGLESITSVESIDSTIEKNVGKGQTAVRALENLSQIYVKAFISKPDVWAARSSFITYYQKYLRDNRMDTDIDWKDHKWNQEAMDYAQMMVDRQQNISDDKLAGKLLSSSKPGAAIFRKVMLPFATFILNQKSRMYNDFITFFGSGVSIQDRVKSGRSIVGLAGEMITYHALAYIIRTMLYDNIAELYAGVDDEEEEKDRRFLNFKTTRQQWNATKFPVKSFITDLLSPFPIIGDDIVAESFDFVMSFHPMITKEDIDQAISDKNAMLVLRGGDPMDDKAEAKFIEKLKEVNTYSVNSFKNKKWADSYGVPGIAFDTYTELFDLGKMATTGEFTEDIGYGPKTKYLTKEGQDLATEMILPMVLFATGLAPKDLGTFSRKVINIAKKSSISETKQENIGLLKEELGRKPKDWEKNLVINTDKKITGVVDAINFAERFANLTPVQSEEYVKVIKEYGDYDFFILQALEKNVKAEDIIKSIKETGNTRNLLD